MHRCNDPDEWDIQKVRVRLLLAGINPEVNICSLDDGYYYNKLTFTRADGAVTFRSTQPNWTESREFARAFSEAHSPLPYRLQTQAVLTHEALLLLLRPKRIDLSPVDREKLVASQDGRCALCNSDLADYEVDHIQPLGSFGSNARANLAALCVPCHSAKSRT